MNKGECHPQMVFPVFSREWGELLFHTNFLAVDTSDTSVHEKRVFTLEHGSLKIR